MLNIKSDKSKYKYVKNVKTVKAYYYMMDRCYNKNTHNYHNYGGRGIRVCDRWLESFRNFYDDMGEKPSDKYSLDRIDVNGNYEPSNCRWADAKTQANNQRRGYSFSVYTIAELVGVSYKTIYNRRRKGEFDHFITAIGNGRYVHDQEIVDYIKKNIKFNKNKNRKPIISQQLV